MNLIQKPPIGIQLNKNHPLAKGLTGCWIMNAGSGNKLFDLRDGINGTLGTGASWIDGHLALVGANGTVAFDNIKLLENPTFTVIIGCSCNVAYGSTGDFLYFGTGGDYLKIQHAAWNHGYKIIEYNGYAGASFVGNITVDDGVYHNVAYRRVATDKRDLFIDGILDTSDTTTVATETSNVRQFNIAASAASDWELHYIYIYDRDLGIGELEWLHREPYAMFQQPISSGLLYAFLDEGITLTIQALDGAGLLDNVTLTQKHTLAVQALSGAGILDNTVLTQKHLLALQELLSSGALDAVSLTQKHLLSVQELSGAGALDNVTLTQKHILAVQELLSSGTLDNIELSISILLIVAELLSSGTLDNVELTQKHNLIIQELASAGALDNVELTQKHLLAIQSLLSAGAIDNIELLLSILLTVSDMLSSGAIDNTTLTQKHVLSIDEVLSNSQIDGIVLTQKHLLIIDSLISSGVIDNINFDVAAGLIYITLSQATEYGITLSQATEYGITLSQIGGGVQ